MRVAALALLAAFAAAPAAAQSPSSPPPPPGAASPADSAAAEKAAGGVTREDFMKRAADRAAQHAGERFDEMDTNHDGVLSRAEIRAWRETHHRARHGETGAEPEPAPTKP